ncbi:antibiotic biosynthesis monooxygenase [Ensifer soli]|uniref:antibiotic biosynthesis monooxygenase n=1 Tax=Ciceribacter sp. sgz301302 TaxID=3342379 RepID=UPI0035BB96C2
MLIQIVTVHVREGCAEEFLDAFRLNYEGTRKEPGNVRFDVLRHADAPNSFSIYEVFRSAEAVEAHRQTEHYKECIRRIESIQAAPRSKVFYEAEFADFGD